MAASFSLIIEDDAGKQIVVPFAKDVITIGRKEGNTIRLTERNVSRFHAKLERQTSGVLVEDLSSFNGVKLNGDRIAGKVLVTAGDVIEIGDYHLELRAAQQAKTQDLRGPVGSRASAVDGGAAPVDGDEFEGDTQRWDPPAAAQQLSVGQPTQEDTVPHNALPPINAGANHGGFAEGSGDTERLDMQHLQSLASQGGQAAPPPHGVGEAQSWPAPDARKAPPAQPMFGPGDLEPTARQPVANVPLGGLAPPPPMMSPMASPMTPSSSASPPTAPMSMPPPSSSASPGLHEPTQDMPMPGRPQTAPQTAPQVAPQAQPKPAPPPARRAAEETEQLRAAPAGPNPADDLSVPRLVVLNTIFSGSTFPLRAMENVLGRTDDNDIVLEHRSVSRNHAKLVREGERVRILDLKSANGVLVNGEEVEQHVLKAGDVIELGRLKMRFVPPGERFVVAPDEIERARLQDAAGDDAYDESASTVNVTSPLRAPRPQSEPPVVAGAKRPVVLYAVFGVLGLVVIALAVALLTGGDDGKTDAQTDTPVDAMPTPVGVLPADPNPANPTNPTNPTDPTNPTNALATPTTPPEPVDVKPTTPPEPELEIVPVELTPPKPDDRRPPPKKKEKEVDFEAGLKEAQQLIFTGDFKAAVPLLKDLEKINKEDPRIHRSLGISYARLRENDKATRHYRRYLELAPNAPDAEKVRDILAGKK